MSTYQTLITLGAFVLLSTLLVTFYQLLGQSGETVQSAQQGITALTLLTTYTELAYGLHFDEATIDSFLTPSEIGLLTHPSNLGKENPPPVGEPYEADFKTFDDFDDLNNYEIVDENIPGVVGRYKTKFYVYYVNPNNIDQKMNTRTFVKRCDIKIWREDPTSDDTLKSSIVMGYFHFD